MKENKSFQFSVQIPYFLSHEKCDEIINTIKETEVVRDGCVTDGKGGEDITIKNIRDANEWYLIPFPNHEFRPNKVNNDWKWLQEKMYNMVNLVNSNCFKFHIEDSENELKLIEYKPNGFYTWHADYSFSCSTRKLAAVIQLTDPNEYEGGDLQFGLQNEDGEWYTTKREKGSITIFPSFFTHRVTPVTKGKRYTLQEFYVGNHFV